MQVQFIISIFILASSIAQENQGVVNKIYCKTIPEVYAYLNNMHHAIFIDVRSVAERENTGQYYKDNPTHGYPAGSYWAQAFLTSGLVYPQKAAFIAQVNALTPSSSSAPNVPNRSIPIVLICRSGVRSFEAGTWLVEDGYETVITSALGVIEWNEQGLPAVQSPCANRTGLNCLYEWESIRAGVGKSKGACSKTTATPLLSARPLQKYTRI